MSLPWTAETVPSSKFIYGVTAAPNIGGGKIFLWGDDTTATHRYVLHSTDASVWTKTDLNVDHGIYNMAWCSGFNATAGMLIACGYNGTTGKGIIMSSTDGLTWTVRQTIVTNNGMFGLAYSPEANRCVCGGENGALFYSGDGITWTDISVGGTADFQNMGWAPGLPAPSGSGLTTHAGVFAAYTNVSKEIYVSTDGITWFHSTTVGPDQRVNTTFSALKLAWVPKLGKFFGDTGSYTGKINVSTDGLNWTTQDIPVQAVADFADSFTGAHQSQDRGLVAVGITAGGVGTSIYSVDGTTWVESDVTATGPVDRITYGTNTIQLFVASKVHTTADTVTTAFGGQLNVSWWKIVLPDNTTIWQRAVTQPPPFELQYDVFADGVFYPFQFTTFQWVFDSSGPDDSGWAYSLDAFSGQAYLVSSDSRPEVTRGWAEIVSFATGSANFFGGFPGSAAIYNNHLVYAPGYYTVGTVNPTLRIYDGQFDRPIATIPNTSSGAVPKAVMSVLVANGVIYVATLDSGTSSADWSGRVFSLDVETGQLTQVGTAFPAGHLPYALCWHAGRLWCGSHRQSSAAAGKVFFIRPEIDTDWTADHDLSGDALASCTALWSYLGKLYVGTAGAAGTFAKILVRDTLGAYSTSLTLTGGAAAANNAVVSMTDFGGNLYAGYWNPDAAGNVATIRKYDGTSWTIAYTGSGETVTPLLALFSDRTVMFAIGGGVGRALILLKTTTGTSWTDQTIFIPDAISTGVPAFGVVVH